MNARALAACMTALAAVSCAAPLMKLPGAPGTPLSSLEAAYAYTEATELCARPRAMTAEVAVSGTVGGRRIRGRLFVGIEHDGFIGGTASARIEAVAPAGPPLFIFVANGDDASLLLPRDARVLRHGRPGDVLDAIAGVPLDAADLHAVLTGCASEPGGVSARAIGADWMILTKPEGGISRILYLQHQGKPKQWRLVAEIRQVGGKPVWRAEYRDFLRDGLPRSIHLLSADAPGRFDLSLASSQVELDPVLGPEVFALQVPDAASPITLEELRREGPLAPQSNGR